MDGIDQLTTLTLAGNNKIAARVDYQTCEMCGFRLKRVETTLIGDQKLIAMRCPICVKYEHENSKQLSTILPASDRLRYFDAWLLTHGLDRDTLKCHYHLCVDHFFDDKY